MHYSINLFHILYNKYRHFQNPATCSLLLKTSTHIYEIDLICLVKADSEKDAKRIVCEKNGKEYNEELEKHIEITAKEVDYKEHTILLF